MRPTLIFTFRALLLFLGVFIFYASLSYETEDGKIQSLLEEWWIKVDDYQRQALSRHIAFLKTIASISTRVLDQLFGRWLISIQSIGVSLCLCSACLGVLSLIVGRIAPHKELSVTSSLWLILSSGLYGIIPSFLERIPQKVLRVGLVYLWFAVLVISQLWGVDLLYFLLMFVVVIGGDANIRLGGAIILGFVAMLLGCIALFVLLVAMMRKTVRGISDSNSAMRIVVMSTLNTLLPFVLIAMIFVGLELPVNGKAGVLIAAIMILGGMFGLVINFPFVLSAFMFVIIALTMFVHRLFWPALARPLYRIQAMGVAKRPTLFKAVSVLLISAAIGKHEWLFSLLDKL